MKSILALDQQIERFCAKGNENVAKYESTISQFSDDIITKFGGLSTMIHLCLTNPQVEDVITPQNFQLFQNLLNNNIIDLNTNEPAHVHSSLNSIKSKNETQIELASQQSIPIIDDGYGNNNIDPKSISDKNESAQQLTPSLDCITVENVDEFYDKNVFIINNASNNFYFNYLPYNYAHYFCFNVLLSKWFQITIACVCSITGVGFLIAQFYSFVLVYVILRSICLITFTIILILYLLSVNIVMVKLMLYSFDFWFKMYNLLLYATANVVIQYHTVHNSTEEDDEQFYKFWELNISIGVATAVIGYICYFMIDGLYLSPKLKTFLTVGTAITTLFGALSAYYTFEDVYYNPFKMYGIETTKIDFKYVYIISLINIVLFILKPTFGEFSTWMYNKLCCTKDENNNKDSADIQKQNGANLMDRNALYENCYALYKQPRVKWIAKSFVNSDQIS